MRTNQVPIGVLALVVVSSMLGCAGSCTPQTKSKAVAVNTEPADDNAEEGEEREVEDERREREKAFASLQAYRAESCSAAIQKMEAALHTGKGRWHEHDEQGALPTELLTRLVEAELWRDQAKPLCANDPQQPRFEELRLLMDGIWRYPATLPREELDKRMAALDH